MRHLFSSSRVASTYGIMNMQYADTVLSDSCIDVLQAMDGSYLDFSPARRRSIGSPIYSSM
jgi:hypothetical protein